MVQSLQVTVDAVSAGNFWGFVFGMVGVGEGGIPTSIFGYIELVHCNRANMQREGRFVLIQKHQNALLNVRGFRFAGG